MNKVPIFSSSRPAVKRSALATLLALGLMMGAASSAWSYDPPTGGQDSYQLLSPLFLGRGFSVTSMESPFSDAMNPSASGLNQRITLDASYIGLTGFGSRDDDRGWQGHAVNLGATFPTRAGVFTGSMRYLGSEVDPMLLGNTFGVKFSFAKDLYRDFLVGAGLNVDTGGYDGQFDVGANLDFGIMHLVGDFGVLKDLRWGASLLGVGLPYKPVDGRDSMPAFLTPALGAQFSLVRSEDIVWDINTTVSYPTVQNARVNLGSEITFFDTVSVFGGWQADARQILDNSIEQRSMLPSFGVSVTLATDFRETDSFIGEQGWNRSEIRTRAAAAPLYDGIWGMGGGVNVALGVVDANPPVVDVAYDRRRYIAPTNDGVNDYLQVPISITDERYVMGWVFRVYDQNNQLVRSIENKDDRPENEGFRNFMDRLLAVKSGVTVPEAIRWDGTSDGGSVVADGAYSFTLEAWDDNGNFARSDPYEVVVDTTPPQVEVVAMSPEERIFSPDGDGSKDELPIGQRGSEEDLWEGWIEDAAGNRVRTWSWHSSAPQPFIWDGTDDSGDLLADGVYRYRIAATDRAGNRGSAGLENIIINTVQEPIRVTIDHAHFSPNDNGVRDTLTFSVDVPASGLLEWELAVLDQAGSVRRSFSGRTAPRPQIVFNGRDADGRLLAEGVYHARLRARYQNGYSPEELSPRFEIDVTPPRAAVRADLEVFAPSLDGTDDEVVIFQETTTEDLWTGRVQNAVGETVRTFTWRGNADISVAWDGTNDEGRLVEDGRYSYELEAVDRAGNRGVSNRVGFDIDNRASEALISAEFRAFSPNNSGVRDTIRFFPRLQINEDIDNYTFSITSDDGEAVRTFTGRDRIPGPFSWNGLDNAGSRAPDGVYRGRLEVLYRNRHLAQAATANFVLDTVYPGADLGADYTLFSPDGDGNRDTIRIRQSSTNEHLWQGAIVSEGGTVVRRYEWRGELSDFTWDGRDESGNVVPNGLYRYVVNATDEAGNRTEVRLEGIEVDTRPTPIFVTADATAFSPNNNGIRDQITFTMLVNNLRGIDDWSLRLLHEGREVRRFAGEAIAAQSTMVWDGTDSDGRVREGRYTAEFRVNYRKGNRPVARTSEFLLDVSPPEVTVNLSPVPFSPDNDGVDDELFIDIDVRNASDISHWQFEIVDRNDRFFNEFSGRGTPAERIIWDGRASNGDLVISAEDYPYRLEVVDVLGNRTVKQGVIPVDILVIRDGDRLRVQIASITFAPNSPELIIDPTDPQGAKNAAILDRLVEIFTRYSTYSIRVEGHAVNITGTEREEVEELQPLSQARADAVRTALVDRGLAARRISTLGRGGTEPVVPHTDLDERWKNRRVEFILIR
ncbi:MAG: hypothetical protein EA384_04345 [Spirochaetaceae bacterium]|nr:MAG: hypothetical protein EA384_04345 [Spirochaetaceae bacterium]